MAQYEVTLRDYWRILRRRKSIVIFTGLLLAFFSFGLASIWKPLPLFRAVAKVQINVHQNLTGLYLQSIAYNSGDEIETQQAIISSFPVLARTADKLDLFSWAQTPDDTATVILDLQTRIATTQEGFTNIIGVEATDPDPVLARDLANTLAAVYRDYDHELKNQQAVRHREFVAAQREKAREVLEGAEEAVRGYREETDLISLDSQASVNLQLMTTSEREVQRLRQDLSALRIMIDEMEREQSISEKSLQGASRLRVGEAFMAMSRQLSSLRLQRDGLLVRYTEGHPHVQQLQAKIDQLGSSMLGELRQRRQSLQRDLKAEGGNLEQLRTNYSQLPSRGLELSRLEREVYMRQEVVTALEEGYQEALIREADKVEDVTVLEWALTPNAPENPHHPTKRAVLGLLLGVILGVVFAVVAETLDTSIGTIEDVQEYTGTQVVGIVPFINVDDVRASLQRRGIDVSDERTVQRKAQLVAYFDPQSTLAETYRTLRTNIEFVTVEKGAKCLMVTSSMHFEGKSTTIANLSMTMAQLGKRTLLVDCDLRKPSIARVFGLDKEPGVTEVIVGNNSWRDVVRTVTDIVTGGMGMEDILQTQGIGNLNIITSGSIPPNPTELLNSRRMADFIAEIGEEYDVVLFDSAPVLHVTDAAILGKMLDGTIMVYKAGDVARTSLKRSTTLLRSVEIELLGVVINGIRADLSTEFQDLGYNAYYAYGSEVAAPERDLAQRVQDTVRHWKTRLGLGNGSDGRYVAHQPEPPAAAEKPASRTGRGAERAPAAHLSGKSSSKRGTVVGAVALVVTLIGLTYQSGYLPRSWTVPLLQVSSPIAAAAAESSLPRSETVASDVASKPAQALSSLPVVKGVHPAGGDSASAFRESAGTAVPVRDPVSAPVRDRAAAANTEIPSVSTLRADGAYTVKMASYPPGNRWARQHLDELRAKGENAYLSPVLVQGERFDRLLIGRFQTWDDAFRHADVLKRVGAIEESQVLRLPYTVGFSSLYSSSADLQSARGSLLPSLEDAAHFAQLPRGDYQLLLGAFEGENEAREYLVRVVEASMGPAEN